jgi:hypothetical protein
MHVDILKKVDKVYIVLQVSKQLDWVAKYHILLQPTW